ncbi:hypothetical protein EST38_g4081 [Candolleomyces aberdarensis]|uniref:Uncharacterized protein n=1 Tax=Candolleomyces aberdarensis TaxID=2316362 RepID=A0A4Q2DRW8_9AGAR|nr:hypothetical protein EST38_g4081 [Candolleomyces aberdarensis]
MQDSRQGGGNTTMSVDHSKAILDPGSLGWEQDLDRLRAKIWTQLKVWEDSQKSSITKQLESFRAQQELQILGSIRSEALEAQTRIDNQAVELQNALDICRGEWDELFRECQTLRARERQLTNDLSETRLALTRQTLDLQADKVKLLEKLNTAKSAPQLHQIKLLEELKAAKSTQAKLLEELSMAKTALAGMAAGANVEIVENGEASGSGVASDEEAYTEETIPLEEELRVPEPGDIGPIDERLPGTVSPQHPQAHGGVNEPFQELASQEGLQKSGHIALVDERLPAAVVPQHPQADAGVNETFQERRRRWQTLAWTAQETYVIEGPCSAYELIGGMFTKTDEEGNVFILQVPTSRDPVYQVITQCKLTTKICGFALDASQDLLVVSGCDNQ